MKRPADDKYLDVRFDLERGRYVPHDESQISEVPPELRARLAELVELHGGRPPPCIVIPLRRSRIEELQILAPSSTLDLGPWAGRLANPDNGPDKLLWILGLVPDQLLGAALAYVLRLPHWPLLVFESPGFPEEIQSGAHRERWHAYARRRESLLQDKLYEEMQGQVLIYLAAQIDQGHAPVLKWHGMREP